MRRITVHFLLLAFLALPASLLAGDLAEYADGPSSYDPQPTGALWQGPNGGPILWNNGPFVNCAGCGAGGADESQLQTSLVMATFGFGNQQQAQNRVADDFTVPPGEQWTIGQITFFGYQTGAPADPSPFVSVNYQIWDGSPANPASSVVFGDNALNRLQSSTFSNVYRVSETTSGATDRMVMANVCSGGAVLGPGTYWLDWQAAGIQANSGPWAPPITINGQFTTGNGQQFIGVDQAWQDLVDRGPQGLPFIIEGLAAVPVETKSWSAIKAAFLD